MKLLNFALLICCLTMMTGCWGYAPPKYPKPVGPFPAAAPAKIGHIVFISLNDPKELGSIQRDADRMLGTIPAVATYASGGHLDTGRASVLSDYDLAIYLGFATQEDLAAYVAHEQHINFVERWKPKIESLRVYDMLDMPNVTLGRCGVGGRKKFLGTF